MNDMTALPEKQAVASFSLVPQNLSQAMELAKLIADSDLAPKDYRGKPGNVLIAVQLGAEIGLSPMTAIQNVAVINGKPSIYGDAGKALLLRCGLVIEEDDVEVIKKTGVARCRITRKGFPPCERTFSKEAAKTASLLGKQGPWTNYPERQMAWRAFWFAARDIASDILKGLGGAEEIRDITERDITPMGSTLAPQLPEYPAEMFIKNLPAWTKLIVTGKKTAAEIIATVCSRAALSDDQKKELADVEAEVTNAIAKGRADRETGETTSMLDDVKRICAAAASITDSETAFVKLGDARLMLSEMNDENKALAIREIDAALASIKERS